MGYAPHGQTLEISQRQVQPLGHRREVGPGDAILTRNGDRHALAQIGEEDLVIFIVYQPVKR